MKLSNRRRSNGCFWPRRRTGMWTWTFWTGRAGCGGSRAGRGAGEVPSDGDGRHGRPRPSPADRYEGRAVIVKPADHLDRLALALAECGLSSRPGYGSVPALLRVFRPSSPWLGDSIIIGPRRDAGEAWFWSASGVPLAPVWDVRQAACHVEPLLTQAERLAKSFGIAPRRRGIIRRLLELPSSVSSLHRSRTLRSGPNRLRGAAPAAVPQGNLRTPIAACGAPGSAPSAGS